MERLSPPSQSAGRCRLKKANRVCHKKKKEQNRTEKEARPRLSLQRVNLASRKGFEVSKAGCTKRTADWPSMTMLEIEIENSKHQLHHESKTDVVVVNKPQRAPNRLFGIGGGW
jgi:hypothetical protein